MQAIQVVVIQGAGFDKVAPAYRLGNDEPIYGGPLEERPNDKSDYGLLKQLGFHGFTCVEYLRDTLDPTVGDQGSGRIKKRLVVIHYLRIREEE